jgi:hypothetical protein
MSAVLDAVWGACRPPIRWTGLAAIVLLAACGGERRESPEAGTEGAAVTDSAPSSADTVAVAAADTFAPTAGDTSTPVAAQDTTAKQQARRPAAPAKPATPAKPAAPARDTASTAASTQDTVAPTTETASGRDTSSGQDTAAAAQGAAAGETQTADAPLRDQYHQAPKDTVNQATYDGWKQYNLNCARCHGEDVLGTTIAADLLVSLKADGPINTPELFTQVVCAGRPAKGMPSWCALGMEPAKITQIYSYVKGRSEGKIRPGRPAVKPEG